MVSLGSRITCPIAIRVTCVKDSLISNVSRARGDGSVDLALVIRLGHSEVQKRRLSTSAPRTAVRMEAVRVYVV